MKINYEQIAINATKRSRALQDIDNIMSGAPETLDHAVMVFHWLSKLMTAYSSLDAEGRSLLPENCARILRDIRPVELECLIGSFEGKKTDNPLESEKAAGLAGLAQAQKQSES